MAEHSWFAFFQVNALLAVYGSSTAGSRSGSSLAPQVTWNPTFVLGSFVALRGDLGISLLKTSASNGDTDTSLLLNAQALFQFALPGQYLEIGGGVQSLSGAYGGTLPVGTVGLAFPVKQWAPLERIFGSYSYSSLASQSIHQIRFGVGVAF